MSCVRGSLRDHDSPDGPFEGLFGLCFYVRALRLIHIICTAVCRHSSLVVSKVAGVWAWTPATRMRIPKLEGYCTH